MILDSHRVHKATLAGRFYPAEKEFLRKVIDRYFSLVSTGSAGPGKLPKAIIAPHSGYIFSGPVAASAYAPWQNHEAGRVILLGPSHQYDFPGVALPDASSFETPLGEVSLDQTICQELLKYKFVRVFQAPFENEQSIETELPFLQRLFSAFQIVPLIVSQVETAQLTTLFSELWKLPDTLFVISSDLSRHHDYAKAKKLDLATAKSIQTFDSPKITSDQACGHRIIKAFLKFALKQKVTCHLADLRNSGDTAAATGDITGFGAFHFYDPR
jgi:AmmeMemoRadiSam system protein B